MIGTRIVLAPLDGTRHATAAVPVACALARLLGASLHVLHVSREPGRDPAELLAALGVDRLHVPELVIEARVGDPAETIVGVAEGWGDVLLVMGTHTGVRAGPGASLGPVCDAVFDAAHRPIVLVPPTRGDAPWALRTMLVPHDGTPATTVALAPAFYLAQRAGATMWALHVASPHEPPESCPGRLGSPRYIDQRQHEWPAWAREFLDRLASGQAVMPKALRLALAHGEPSSVIARFAAARQADLVVLCSHGLLGPGRGSVLRAVLRDAREPVLVLRCG
jgi:nucleotide-binding universal stress UspA family protein